MRRRLILFLCLAWGLPGLAAGLPETRLTLSGAATRGGLSAVNTHFEDQARRWRGLGEDASTQAAGTAWQAGADLLARLSDWPLFMGLRGGYVACDRAALSVPGLELSSELDASLVPLMAGLRLSLPLGAGLSAEAEAFGGVGLASATLFTKNFGYAVRSRLSGSAFCGEAAAGLRWAAWGPLALALKAGWRQCQVPELRYSGDDQGSPNLGQRYENSRNRQAIPFDFSGWTLGGGVEIRVL
jgi:hypothetical protein